MYRFPQKYCQLLDLLLQSSVSFIRQVDLCYVVRVRSFLSQCPLFHSRSSLSIHLFVSAQSKKTYRFLSTTMPAFRQLWNVCPVTVCLRCPETLFIFHENANFLFSVFRVVQGEAKTPKIMGCCRANFAFLPALKIGTFSGKWTWEWVVKTSLFVQLALYFLNQQ